VKLGVTPWPSRPPEPGAPEPAYEPSPQTLIEEPLQVHRPAAEPQPQEVGD
jgi:hypothetical protein